MDTGEDILLQLNHAQREAVVSTDGPTLIVAGAGSGKTRVLTYRIAYLLQKGIQAGNILALTFTNKAAREMKERISRLVGEEAARYLWMGTFHSVCTRILRQHAELLGYTRDFSIYDTADSKSLVKKILKELSLDEKIYKPGIVLNRISAAKNVLVTSDTYPQNAAFAADDRQDRFYAMPDIYHIYTMRLKEANAMDFDDLLLNLTLLFRQQADLLRAYQYRFRYLLVDEYQDTNFAQYVIVRMLAEPEHNICVVGDDAQSIYAFRGADIRNILSFRQDFPDAQIFKLERNYRSTRNIVAAAGSLIEHNENQIPKHLYSENEEGDPLPLTPYFTDRDEAAGIADKILFYKHNATEDYSDVAVLYRTNAQSRVLENELRKRNIPYIIYGGLSFYQRKEIKDAVAYLRLLANHKDNEALLRIINYPARGIGDATVQRLTVCAAANHTSIMDVLLQPQPIPLDVSAAAQKRLYLFVQLVQQMENDIDTMDAFTFAENVLVLSGIMTDAAMDESPEGRDRKQNLDELLSAISEFVAQRLQEGISFTPIQDFLAEVSLLTDQDEKHKTDGNHVTLMTVHAAKGLEFPTVYVAGLEENLFPSQMCTTAAEIEEERRLFYVAITRAMQHCRLSYANQRFRNGRADIALPSRFLKDIDKRYLQLAQTPMAHFSYEDDTSWNNQPWQSHDTPRHVMTMPAMPRLKPISAAKPLTHCSFSSGDRVQHRVFGQGTVIRTYNDNDNDKIDIDFDEVGNKTLLLAYAKLEKL